MNRLSGIGVAGAAACLLLAGVFFLSADGETDGVAAATPSAVEIQPRREAAVRVAPPAAAPRLAVAAAVPSASAPAAGPSHDPNWGVLAAHGSGALVQVPPSAGVGREIDLQAGDRIVRVNGAAVTGPADLKALTGRLPPRATIRIDGFRDGKPITLIHSTPELVPDDQVNDSR